jgi:hypothetical protein
MNSKIKIDKQGKSDYIIETKLGLQAKSRRLHPPAPHGSLYIGGQVLRVPVGCDTNS